MSIHLPDRPNRDFRFEGTRSLEDIYDAIIGLTLTVTSATTGTQVNVAQNASSVLLLAANTDRVEFYIINNTNKDLYISITGVATVGSGITVAPGDSWFTEKYKGALHGIWSGAGGGHAQVTETLP